MTNFIPIFPLNIVVYPSEQLNLHIFEDRYKQLIAECFAENKPFGIPSVLENGLAEYGTLVAIKEVVEIYEDGKMDIKTEGLKVFRVLETVKTIPDKLYSGAIVTYPENETATQFAMMQKILNSIKQLHELMQVIKDFKKPNEHLLSYDIAHHVGLTLQEEYELLSLWKEVQRLEYLKRHIHKVRSVLDEVQNLKNKIQLNGHFKELKGFNLDTE
jgi:Lon protease-like protein